MSRVAVIGGGLAGIAAALECADAGLDVTLLEVRPRLGGAAYSFERDGLTVDNGQHVFLRCCTEYRALLARLGVLGDVVLQDRLEIPVLRPDGRRAVLRRSGLPAPLHLSWSLARFGVLSLGARARVARGMLALRRVDPDDPRNDARPFGEWLATHGQRAEEIEALWRLIVLPTVNLEPARASLAQVAQVFRTGLLEDASAGDIGYARVPLSELHDGPALRALQRAGVDVRLRWRAEKVVDGRVLGGPEPVEADAFVLAVPHTRVAALAPPEAEVPEFSALGASPIVNVHVVYETRVLDVPFAAGVGTPVQFVFDRTRGGAGQYLTVSLSAADAEMAAEPDVVRERYLAALGELLPPARVERAFITREHAATFRAEPGARALRPGPATALPNVALAGAWTDTGWPATMEGAVRSGRAAAAQVIGASVREEALA